MIDSYSDIVLRAGDATPKDIVLRPAPSPRNPQNKYPTAAQVATGIQFGPGQLQWQEYETGTAAAGGTSYPLPRMSVFAGQNIPVW